MGVRQVVEWSMLVLKSGRYDGLERGDGFVVKAAERDQVKYDADKGQTLD